MSKKRLFIMLAILFACGTVACGCSEKTEKTWIEKGFSVKSSDDPPQSGLYCAIKSDTRSFDSNAVEFMLHFGHIAGIEEQKDSYVYLVMTVNSTSRVLREIDPVEFLSDTYCCTGQRNRLKFNHSELIKVDGKLFNKAAGTIAFILSYTDRNDYFDRDAPYTFELSASIGLTYTMDGTQIIFSE